MGNEEINKSIILYLYITALSHEILSDMALMRMANAWERFVLKDLTKFGQLAKVELTPPGPGELVGAVKGVGGLVKDTLTFRWAQVFIFKI